MTDKSYVVFVGRVGGVGDGVGSFPFEGHFDVFTVPLFDFQLTFCIRAGLSGRALVPVKLCHGQIIVDVGTFFPRHMFERHLCPFHQVPINFF